MFEGKNIYLTILNFICSNKKKKKKGKGRKERKKV
jgi:hypothetical protein